MVNLINLRTALRLKSDFSQGRRKKKYSGQGENAVSRFV